VLVLFLFSVLYSHFSRQPCIPVHIEHKGRSHFGTDPVCLK